MFVDVVCCVLRVGFVLFAVWCFVGRCALFVVCCLLFVVRCVWYAVWRLVLGGWCVLFAV